MNCKENLAKAKKEKNDEFYTQLEFIVSEIKEHNDYAKHFENKIVLLNCNDSESSAFAEFFIEYFNELKLKKLISVSYNKENTNSYMLEYNGKVSKKVLLESNGDFRSEECISLLKESDIVVTNPPFSLFREFVSLLMEYEKKFLIIGSQNAITYKEIFSLIKENKIWLGYYSGDMFFRVPDNSEPKEVRYWVDEEGKKWRSLGNICWFTNLDIDKRHKNVTLTYDYIGREDYYKKYDNCNAINIDKLKEIPMNYNGLMGVPITFLTKFCPEQFEIVKFRKGDDNKDLCVNGKCPYFRILIKKI